MEKQLKTVIKVSGFLYSKKVMESLYIAKDETISGEFFVLVVNVHFSSVLLLVTEEIYNAIETGKHYSIKAEGVIINANIKNRSKDLITFTVGDLKDIQQYKPIQKESGNFIGTMTSPIRLFPSDPEKSFWSFGKKNFIPVFWPKVRIWGIQSLVCFGDADGFIPNGGQPINVKEFIATNWVTFKFQAFNTWGSRFQKGSQLHWNITQFAGHNTVDEVNAKITKAVITEIDDSDLKL